MATTRAMSLKLLNILQILTQNGFITAMEAKEACAGYLKGDDSNIKAIIYNPDIPVSAMRIVTELEQFLNKN